MKLDSVMEESLGEVESEEQSAIDMLASNNSEEFSPEMVAVTKAQQLADSAEDKMTEAVSWKYFSINFKASHSRDFKF